MSNILPIGQRMTVRATGREVEIVYRESATPSGRFYMNSREHPQTLGAYAMDVETRQISLYLLPDLQPLS